MIYTKTIITSANTLEVNQVTTRLRVSKGLVYKFEVAFPPGPAGLVHIQVFDGAHQVWPSSPGETFHSDDQIISFDDLFLKDQEPSEFQIVSWNNDDTYDHEVQVRIGMVTAEIFMARFLPSLSYEKMKELLILEQVLEEARLKKEKEELLLNPY